MGIVKKTVTVFVCERCEHEWIPRDPDTLPTVCPKCKSPYWNRPRRSENPKATKKRGGKKATAKTKRS